MYRKSAAIHYRTMNSKFHEDEKIIDSYRRLSIVKQDARQELKDEKKLAKTSRNFNMIQLQKGTTGSMIFKSFAPEMPVFSRTSLDFARSMPPMEMTMSILTVSDGSKSSPPRRIEIVNKVEDVEFQKMAFNENQLYKLFEAKLKDTG